jgi:hypothetical protein
MAHFVPANIDSAKEFLTKHHWGVLSTRRKDGNLQMSPITPGLDAKGRVIISSRETAYKVEFHGLTPVAPPYALRRAKPSDLRRPKPTSDGEGRRVSSFAKATEDTETFHG